MKHTPGPWMVQSHESVLYISADLGLDWNNPVVCNFYDDVTPDDSVTVGSWLEAVPNAEANAKLIAAAPDLLSCALALLDALDRDLPNNMKHHAAGERFNLRTAIAKAEGVV